MAQTRKRRAVSAPFGELSTKRRYSAPLSDEQREQLRKAVLYLAPRYGNRLVRLGIFDEARALLGLNHRSGSLRRMFSLWLKENKGGEWERMKEQEERYGHEVYFADLIELDSANAEGGGAQVNDGPPQKAARVLTNDEKLAKAVLYLAPRTVGEGRRYKGIKRDSKIYAVVKELLGLEQNAATLRISYQRWLKGNKNEWEAMKAQSELDADYFDELIESEEELIRQGVLEDTRPQEEEDAESDASTLYYDVSPLPAFDENGWAHDDGGQQEHEEEIKMEEEEREEAGQPTGGATSGEVVIVHHHHHHHEHHYHCPVTNYYASGQDQGAHFPPPSQ